MLPGEIHVVNVFGRNPVLIFRAEIVSTLF